MTKVVQDFLWAQKVQKPIALFSDWLLVGHVDEFMTFVPAPDRKVNTRLLNRTAKRKYPHGEKTGSGRPWRYVTLWDETV